MNSYQLLLGLCVFVPILGSLLALIVGPIHEGARNVLAFVSVLSSFVCAAFMLPLVTSPTDNTATLTMMGVDLLHADRLAVFMALVSTGVGSIIVFYSWGYIAKYRAPRRVLLHGRAVPRRDDGAGVLA